MARECYNHTEEFYFAKNEQETCFHKRRGRKGGGVWLLYKVCLLAFEGEKKKSRSDASKGTYKSLQTEG